MSDHDKSFEDLLKEAPAAPEAGTVSLVGTLARSSEEGKFLLTVGDGTTLTLETAAVKHHAVLGSSVGQTIVRVDVDAAKLPAAGAGVAQTPNLPIKPQADGITVAGFDLPITIPDIDHPFTLWWHDHTVAFFDHPKPLYSDVFPQGTGFADPIGPGTLQEGIGVPIGGNPIQGATVAPFALATPHQASMAGFGGLQGGLLNPQPLPWFRSLHFADKNPWTDPKAINDWIAGATNPASRFPD